jgi:hypothetical protein
MSIEDNPANSRTKSWSQISVRKPEPPAHDDDDDGGVVDLNDVVAVVVVSV